MKIAITTPSGHVGSATTDILLGMGKDFDVILLGRRPKNLERFVQRGAGTVIGAQDDANYLIRATRRCDALLWVTPPGYGSDHLRAFQGRLAKAGAEACRTNKIGRVVNLSSMGAQSDAQAGPISGLRDVENILNEAAGNILHLRPGFFFENLLSQLDPIRKWGRISLPLSGSTRFPMIATRDIGRAAAKWLADGSWTGQKSLELHGPVDLSFDEVAGILSDVLGRKISYVRCNPQQAREAIIGGGVSEDVADQMLEMYDAVDKGRVRTAEPRSAETTTPTNLTEFAREVMLPMLAQPVAY